MLEIGLPRLTNESELSPRSIESCFPLLPGVQLQNHFFDPTRSNTITIPDRIEKNWRRRAKMGHSKRDSDVKIQSETTFISKRIVRACHGPVVRVGPGRPDLQIVMDWAGPGRVF